MPIPRLLHPVNITVQRANKPGTFVDDDYREPVQQAARLEAFTIKGQVAWKYDQRLTPQAGGAREDSMGYIVFRVVDLNAISQVIARGDRFTQIGLIKTDVYVVKVIPMAHWPDQAGATLIHAHFQDRQPGRQNRDTL